MPPASHPQTQEILATPGALSHTPCGGGTLLLPPDLELGGVGGNGGGSVCRSALPLGRTGGSWERTARGLICGSSAVSGWALLILCHMFYTQGPYEGDIPIFISEMRRLRAGCNLRTITQPCSERAGLRTSLVDSTVTEPTFS